jgi:hypothetical protein
MGMFGVHADAQFHHFKSYDNFAPTLEAVLGHARSVVGND